MGYYRKVKIESEVKITLQRIKKKGSPIRMNEGATYCCFNSMF